MAKDVQERIDEGLQDYRDKVDQIKDDLKNFANKNFKNGSYDVSYKGKDKSYENMPRRHPLLDSDGVADTSKEDYTEKDSKVIFNTETFGQCLEERQVTSGPYVDECRNRCPTGWRRMLTFWKV